MKKPKTRVGGCALCRRWNQNVQLDNGIWHCIDRTSCDNARYRPQ